MTYLRFYEIEEAWLKENCDTGKITLTEEQATRIVKKLCRHFKFNLPVIRFYGHREGNGGTGSAREIRVPHDTSLSMLIHELAHSHDIQKHRINHIKGAKLHTKKLFTTIRRFTLYCQKKNFWSKEAA